MRWEQQGVMVGEGYLGATTHDIAMCAVSGWPPILSWSVHVSTSIPVSRVGLLIASTANVGEEFPDPIETMAHHGQAPAAASW